jgi:hypothetical protein
MRLTAGGFRPSDMKKMLVLLSLGPLGCSACGESNAPTQQPGMPGLVAQALAAASNQDS